MRLGVSLAGFAVAAETTNVAGRAAEPGSQAGRPGLGSVWIEQMAGYDALAVASAVGRAVPRISAGTAVVPIYPRPPQILPSAGRPELADMHAPPARAILTLRRAESAIWTRKR